MEDVVAGEVPANEPVGQQKAPAPDEYEDEGEDEPEEERGDPGWTDTREGDTEADKIEKSIYATYGEDMYKDDGTIKDWAQAVIDG